MVFIVLWLGQKRKKKQVGKSVLVVKMTFEIIVAYEIQNSIS